MYFYVKNMKNILKKYENEDKVTFYDRKSESAANVISATKNGQYLELTSVTDDTKPAITVKELKQLLNDYNLIVDVIINEQNYDEMAFLKYGPCMQLRGSKLYNCKDLWDIRKLEVPVNNIKIENFKPCLIKYCGNGFKKPRIKVSLEDVYDSYNRIIDCVSMAASYSEDVSPVISADELQSILKDYSDSDSDLYYKIRMSVLGGPAKDWDVFMETEDLITDEIDSAEACSDEMDSAETCSLEMEFEEWNRIWNWLEDGFITLKLAFEAREIINSTFVSVNIQHSTLYKDLIDTIESYDDGYLDPSTFAYQLFKNAWTFTENHCDCELSDKLSPVVGEYIDLKF